MKTDGLLWPKTAGMAGLLLGLLIGTGLEPARAQSFLKPGTIVTNFTVYNRRAWTNEAGRIFPRNAPLRLSDFAGSIVFFEFFDPT